MLGYEPADNESPVRWLEKNLNQALAKIEELKEEINDLREQNKSLEAELYNSQQFWPD